MYTVAGLTYGFHSRRDFSLQEQTARLFSSPGNPVSFTEQIFF
jgi:hypothetical protein